MDIVEVIDLFVFDNIQFMIDLKNEVPGVDEYLKDKNISLEAFEGKKKSFEPIGETYQKKMIKQLKNIEDIEKEVSGKEFDTAKFKDQKVFGFELDAAEDILQNIKYQMSTLTKGKLDLQHIKKNGSEVGLTVVDDKHVSLQKKFISNKWDKVISKAISATKIEPKDVMPLVNEIKDIIKDVTADDFVKDMTKPKFKDDHSNKEIMSFEFVLISLKKVISILGIMATSLLSALRKSIKG